MSGNRRNEIFDKLHKLPISRSGDRAPRIAVKLRVHIGVTGRINFIEAVTVNISRTGILLAVSKVDLRYLEIGKEVQLDIDLDREIFSEQIATPAKVVRHVEPTDRSTAHTWVGMKFAAFVD